MPYCSGFANILEQSLSPELSEVVTISPFKARRFASHVAFCEEATDAVNTGIAMATSTAIIPTTTSSSAKVKPDPPIRSELLPVVDTRLMLVHPLYSPKISLRSSPVRAARA
ncbi:hypothetical protein SDC9_194774 [bioreactor metagenome]|uniref:Uncharacterized protein n=1 Tax=bioreactor metagenome TaxID=1076179 RepID=A0A645IIK0_9ZZZZ